MLQCVLEVIKEMNERLKQLRKELKLNQTEFGKSIGLSHNQIAQIEIGRRNLTIRNANIICKTHNVNREWLFSGKGNMFMPPEEKSTLDELAANHNLDEYDIQLLRRYIEMDTFERLAFRKILQKLVGGIEDGKKNS